VLFFLLPVLLPNFPDISKGKGWDEKPKGCINYAGFKFTGMLVSPNLDSKLLMLKLGIKRLWLD
jgi:hypothetical protein